MDQSCSYTSSSSSSSCPPDHPPKKIQSSRTSYLKSLHSVRKPLQKPMTKHFIAPLPPTLPKVYNVDSSHFKEVVRVLTSTPEFQYPSVRRLQDIAPPPLVLSTIPKPSLFPKQAPPPPAAAAAEASEGEGTVSPVPTFYLSPDFCKFLNETLDTSRFTSKSSPAMDYFGALSPLGLSLSPTPQAYNPPAGGALMSPLGFCLSPSSLSWCSSLLLSPGTHPAFSQSPVV